VSWRNAEGLVEPLWTLRPNAMIRRGVASQEAGVSPTIQIVEDRPNVDRSTGEERVDEDRRTGRSSNVRTVLGTRNGSGYRMDHVVTNDE
jgi:hypothetical protein